MIRNRTLNAASALLVVLLYLVTSIIASLFAAIFLGGMRTSATDRVIDGVVDSGMVANLIVLAGVLFVSIWFFRGDRKQIYFEPEPLRLSKRYSIFPLAWLGVSLFVLTQVDYAAYSFGVILLVVIASLTIGANEEIVTRGILLAGLRNSGVSEWIAWLITLAVFSLLHLVNVFGGANLTILLVTMTGGTILYVSRRVCGNLFVPISLHALYNTAFYLLTGKYAMGESLPGNVLDLQLGAFLALLVVSILFPIFWARPLQTRS